VFPFLVFEFFESLLSFAPADAVPEFFPAKLLSASETIPEVEASFVDSAEKSAGNSLAFIKGSLGEGSRVPFATRVPS